MLDDLDSLPQLIVFDLDDTLWSGEVDSSGGPPFTPHKSSRHTIYCQRRRPMTLFQDVPSIFDDLVDHGVSIAYASRTWEPDWAKEALRNFECGKEKVVNMWSAASGHSWGDIRKTSHMRDISQQLAIPISSMVFIDNDMRNIKDIRPLGATCGYCPEGLDWAVMRNTLMEHSDLMRKV